MPINSKYTFLICCIFSWFYKLNAQITLSHNIGNTPIQTDMFSCDRSQSWYRHFNLDDFGIESNENLVINSGQIALYNTVGGGRLQFNIYKADSNFPNTFSFADYIGSSEIMNIPEIGEDPQILNIIFDTPIIISEGIDGVVVEAKVLLDISNPEQSLVYIAGSEEDNDISYYSGCFVVYTPTNIELLEPPIYNTNFYINVTGDVITTDNLGSSTLLTHNPCEDIVQVDQYGCNTGGLKFGRVFSLEDFGVSNNEELILDRGQVAIGSVSSGAVTRIQFRVYKVDDNFPSSYSQSDLIGSSQTVAIPYFGAGNGIEPRLFEVFFSSPIVIPAEVDKVLIEVFNLGGALLFIAGGTISNDDSWLGGCTPFQEYIVVTNPGNNFYINATGRTNNINNDFEMRISNICSEFLKEFSLSDTSNVASVIWDFGDPASGANNTSSDFSPFHDFSEDGTYTITAVVAANDGNVETLTETIDVREPPNAFGIDNLIQCEDELNTGISSTFDTSSITDQVLGDQLDKLITYIDGSGNEYDELPNPFTNTIPDLETIIVRVAHEDTPCCFSEITFDLIINRASDSPTLSNINECETNSGSGIAQFNFQEVATSIIDGDTNIEVDFFYEDGQQILAPLEAVNNNLPNEETITVVITNTDTTCSSETTFKLIVNALPVSVTLPEIIGCDDNNDGISEFFDTSNVESLVLEDQPTMFVSYFDSSGNQLPSPLPNPFTNSTLNEETITVRVTNNINSDCYVETPLILRTATQPNINTPINKYTCNEGSGFGSFDLSTIETEIIGNQTNLNIMFFETNGNEINNLSSVNFQNTVPFSQTINIRVEDIFSPICFSETSFDLIVNDLPVLELEGSYFLCNLEPFLDITVNNSYESYTWIFEDGSIISNTFEAQLVDAGNYALTIGQLENGIICENNFDFQFIRSSPPTILDVNSQELSNNNNFIEIIASGDGDFEYSIDGINYKDNNYFSNINGGIYQVFVRDKLGCGEDSMEVVLIDYPKFFTPNGDGNNDYWQIEGITEYPISEIFIFDRYGKLLKQLSPNSQGWDGTYNGKMLNTDDYWFTVNLNNEKRFSGHFTLKR